MCVCVCVWFFFIHSRSLLVFSCLHCFYEKLKNIAFIFAGCMNVFHLLLVSFVDLLKWLFGDFFLFSIRKKIQSVNRVPFCKHANIEMVGLFEFNCFRSSSARHHWDESLTISSFLISAGALECSLTHERPHWQHFKRKRFVLFFYWKSIAGYVSV